MAFRLQLCSCFRCGLKGFGGCDVAVALLFLVARGMFVVLYIWISLSWGGGQHVGHDEVRLPSPVLWVEGCIAQAWSPNWGSEMSVGRRKWIPTCGICIGSEAKATDTDCASSWQCRNTGSLFMEKLPGRDPTSWPESLASLANRPGRAETSQGWATDL